MNRHGNTMAEPAKATSISLHTWLVSIEPLDVAIKIFVSFLLVSLVFFALFVIAPANSKKTVKLRASWALKAVSVVHAVVVAGASLWSLLYEPGIHEITTGVFQRDAEAVRWPLIHARSDVLAAAAPLTLAYFLFDLLLVPVWEGRLAQHIPVFLHHGLSLLTWPVGLCHPACHFFLLCCLSMEFSTPFLQYRWFIIQSDRHGKDHPLYLVNGLIMTVAFGACRLYPMLPHNLWAIYVSTPHSADSGLPLLVRVASSALVLPNVLNLYWGHLMFKGLAAVIFCSKKGGTQRPASSSAAAAAAATSAEANTTGVGEIKQRRKGGVEFAASPSYVSISSSPLATPSPRAVAAVAEAASPSLANRRVTRNSNKGLKAA